MTIRIIITGTVQGVGFRPFIYNLANSLNLKGSVSNTSAGVSIEINVRELSEVERFISLIREKKPSASKIDSIDFFQIDDKNFSDFVILKSEETMLKTAFIPSDLSICGDCRKDVMDLSNSRYLYPFTNCTNCGPRFTITERIPYDRRNTSMRYFKMCRRCRNEYDDPLNRRFHAQPNACPLCGPTVWCYDGKKKIFGVGAIDFIAQKIIDGDVVLIKGLGGFHIACDAFNKKGVNRVREIKKREFKPLAVMVKDIKDIERYVFINDYERKLLTSPQSPIVMLRKKNKKVFEYVAPLLDNVGVMVAYTPLHLVLFMRLLEKGFGNPLVMTSGNFKDEPIIADNSEVLEKFKDIPTLFHNREIVNRIDDSVCFVDDRGDIRMIRRARGYVPDGINVDSDFKYEIFASGSDIKNAFAFFRNKTVVLSQHIGDLDIKENADHYVKTYKNIKKLFSFKPNILVSDMHPHYRSSILSSRFGIKKTFKVQHHIAHIYSVMAENSIKDNVIGIAFDGTGYGADGTVWGGEIFCVKRGIVKRVAHLESFVEAGGDKVIKQIWRSFISVFKDRKDFVFEILKNRLPLKTINVYLNMIEKNVNTVKTTSCGRLFDAFSVLVSGKIIADFEAEGPMRMEALLKESNDAYRFRVVCENGMYVIRFSQSVDEVIDDYMKKSTLISVKFHNAIINSTLEAIEILSKENGIKRVVMSGGVFQNRYILNKMLTTLSRNGYEAYSNSLVPTNDGGISLGQIYFIILGHKTYF